MTPAEFTEALHRLHLNRSSAAGVLGVSRRQVYRYLNGPGLVPGPVSMLINLMLAGNASADEVRAA